MIILQALYFALPMYVANMAPVIMKSFPYFDKPIDGGVLLNGKPILGKNKTWRGVIFAILFALAIVYIQQFLFKHTELFFNFSLFGYDRIETLFLAVLLGFGAIFGDAVKSLFKRRLGKPSGTSWVPFDQIDFIVGGLAFGALIYWPGWKIALIILIATPFLHWLTNYVAFKLKIKDVPW